MMKITCECNGTYNNDEWSKKRHLKSKTHNDFITTGNKKIIYDKHKIINCVCGGTYLDKKEKMERHMETMKHKSNVTKIPKILITFHCECGSILTKITPLAIEEHNKTFKHLGNIVYLNSVIYCHIYTGYIGSSFEYIDRLKHHITDCFDTTSVNYNKPLYKYIRTTEYKLTPDEFEIIEYYPCENDEELRIREQYWMDKFGSYYNNRKAHITEEQSKISKRGNGYNKGKCDLCDKEMLIKSIPRHKKTQH